MCRDHRSELRSRTLYCDILRQVRADNREWSTDAFAGHYANLTGLSLEQVRDLFSNHHWRGGYGGEKWAIIADTVIALKIALDAADAKAAEGACRELKRLWHNTEPLVPTRERWNRRDHILDKWPELCEG